MGMTLRKVLMALSICVALLCNPLLVAADMPQPVTIEQHSSRTCPCTFVATGAISDTGSVSLDDFHASAIPSPVVGTGHFIRTYHGQHGTFTIQLETLLTGTDDPTLLHEQGHWVIVDGTGRYTGLHGTGDESGTRNTVLNTLDAVFDGHVH
jgi:hypothetical protein